MPELSDLIKPIEPISAESITNEEIVEKPEGFFRKTITEKPINKRTIESEIASIDKRLAFFNKEIEKLTAQKEAKLSQIKALGE